MIIQDTYTKAIPFLRIDEYPQIKIQDKESFLFHYTFDKQFGNDLWHHYLNFLPYNFQNEVLRFRRWQDRYNCLLGKLMVYVGFKIFYNSELSFENFLKDSYGKPYIKDCKMNFNISHSGNTVVCIFSKEPIGIDVEEAKDIEYTLFENVFTDQEMKEISSVGLSKFYEYWTKKEAIIKAIGKGMSIPLLDIEVKGDHSIYDGIKWNIKSLKLNNMNCAIASKYNTNNVNLFEVVF
ncbi:4'-phosphopantetheinyl transferase family protein [Aquimarina mytili]|uniref:4'-phosphopantetheinyl transferase superfamily protein n=1 Tax=Aquimarina mytili TaxID=874423 RepID=A0A937D724_9FLAO|nr:4'-phosphopantetheinyl transferase superfamily protein [Aquimarina mytili]MBL0685059.1 4'-phosphopantetheinyl transferase superfamily protein [Aquimarina mytili]